MGGKITQVEIEDLRSAKKMLEELQTMVGADDSAAQWAGTITPGSQAFGGGLDGHGDDFGQFIDLRANKIKTVLTSANGAVGNVLALLTTTIANYEQNEDKQKNAANDTPAGQSRGTSSAPSGSRG